MKSKPEVQLAEPWNRQGDTLKLKPVGRHRLLKLVAGAVAIFVPLFSGIALAQDNSTRKDSDNSPVQLRQFIGQQVGGIDKLQIPATNAAIPVPPPVAGSGNTPYRYQTTEAKRYLGKLLFHDPIRTTRIDINQGQPKNLPAGTDFGGTFGASDPTIKSVLPDSGNYSSTVIQNIVTATKQTGSCGSCHIGEAAGKAGQQINFNVGAEGRGYTDAQGNFFPRRRPQESLPKLRTIPLFAGDVLVDAFPTLTDIWNNNGTLVVTTPAYYYHLSPADQASATSQTLTATGRLDQLDSVARLSMNLVGFAFNNRLLFGGFAGEPQSTPGSLNPFNDPAGENLTLLLLDAHRMLNFQSAALLQIPAFVKLFRDAFPQEAAAADAANDLTILVNDQTVFRATATFLRTVVTRNTPFDKFLAGDNSALTPSQVRGAQLFFTPATNGAGGAGCFTCHSGPMLNKQNNDPDVAGIGTFVEENFFNVGIGDHPIRALDALARGHIDPTKLGADGFPYHAEDVGRQEITHDPADAFMFRSLTMRQLKNSGNFMHNASFTNVRDVVEYFNAGVPQDPTAGAAATLTPRFTNPRGTGYPNGLGLTEQQVDDLTDFLENALYDPALVTYDPNSSTDTFQPNVHDLTYSKYRPDLAALGAKDGFVPSGLATDSNDPLTRRDEGLEFLDVTSQANTVLTSSSRTGSRQQDVYEITNSNASTVIDTHLLIIVKGLSSQFKLENASGTTSAGDPYIRVFLPDGVLEPGQSISRTLIFTRRAEGGEGEGGGRPIPVGGYTLSLLSGQGNP
jgi:Di-haem cytochrome c peroxidase